MNEQPKQDTTKLVQCRKTGVWYSPDQKFEELKAQQWFVDLLKRTKDKFYFYSKLRYN